MQERFDFIDESLTSGLISSLAEKVCAENFNPVEKEVELFGEMSELLKPVMKVSSIDHAASIDIFRKYNQALEKYLNQAFSTPDQLNVKEIFRNYTKELEVYISSLPKQKTFIQDEARFTVENGDALRVRVIKSFKGFVRGVQVAVRPFISFFLRLAGKPKIGMPLWKHTVAVRQVFRFSMRNEFLEELFPAIEASLKAANGFHFRLMEMERVLSDWYFLESTGRSSEKKPRTIIAEFESAHKQISIEVREARDVLMKEIAAAGKQALEKYRNLERISGTFEYPDAKSAVGTINRKYSRLLLELAELSHNYGNASHFIFEDWRFKTSLNGLSTLLLKEKRDLLSLLNEKYNLELTSFTSSYAGLLTETETFIKDRGSSLSVLKKILKEFKAGFASLLIRTLSSIKSKALPVRIRNISRLLSSVIAVYPESRIFIRKFDPAEDYSDKDILEIRPADILRFEILPGVETGLKELSAEASGMLESIFSLMTDIGTIAEFSIESAVKQIIDRHEGDKEPAETMVEGLTRSGEKIQVLLGNFSEFKVQMEKELSSLIVELLIEIQELKENEKVFSLNMRLAQARLKRRTKERSRKLKKTFSSGFERVLLGPGRLLKNSFMRVQRAFNMVVYSAAPESISAELSAYLSESKSAIDRLPYIYQRLYLVEPLKEDLFYYKREQETGLIDAAIVNWENGHYSPVALLCEKGSGSTSFINQYRKSITKYPSVQIGSIHQLYSREDFLSFLSKNLKLEGNDLESIIKQLNSGEYRMVFLEDLQNLYLRTVDGFNALKTLFSLMSLTNEKVMWICSCTRYAWNYLELSQNISGYFNYMIQLNQLDASAMRELILIRHIISGYTIKYAPNKVQERTRQYRKITAEEKQAYLEERYFSNMNKFARGNVSLALHFWLRSTKEVQDKQIIISSIYDSDYSFLNTLTTNQLVILTMISLHDGLNARHVSQIMRKPIEEAERGLNQLYDDSIVVKRENDYLVNPLLYRQVVEFLKNKNFIQ